ncbi:MAG TPA: hypothetical protein VMD06_10710, partial [Steroidobacteraceae bacterium]|nr:hypothetical protein [Steroidobacteraceae bacterium]
RTMLSEVLHPGAAAPPASVALPRPAATANGKLARLESARRGADSACGNPSRRCGKQLALNER